MLAAGLSAAAGWHVDDCGGGGSSSYESRGEGEHVIYMYSTNIVAAKAQCWPAQQQREPVPLHAFRHGHHARSHNPISQLPLRAIASASQGTEAGEEGLATNIRQAQAPESRLHRPGCRSTKPSLTCVYKVKAARKHDAAGHRGCEPCHAHGQRPHEEEGQGACRHSPPVSHNATIAHDVPGNVVMPFDRRLARRRTMSILPLARPCAELGKMRGN
jgi:hypothetical protein